MPKTSDSQRVGLVRGYSLKLGLRLKLLRLTAGLKQHDVAHKLGVTSNYVSMLERGTREPTLRFLREFAGIVNVPAAILLWDSADSGSDPALESLAKKVDELLAEYATVRQHGGSSSRRRERDSE